MRAIARALNDTQATNVSGLEYLENERVSMHFDGIPRGPLLKLIADVGKAVYFGTQWDQAFRPEGTKEPSLGNE